MGKWDAPEVQAVLSWLQRRLAPGQVLVWCDGSEGSNVPPIAVGKVAGAGPVTVYVCRDQACQAPVGTLAELKQLL